MTGRNTLFIDLIKPTGEQAIVNSPYLAEKFWNIWNDHIHGHVHFHIFIHNFLYKSIVKHWKCWKMLEIMKNC